MKNFAKLCENTGVTLQPELEALYLQWCKTTKAVPFVQEEFIINCSKKFGLSQKNTDKLLTCLAEINGDEDLLELALFLRDDMCIARHRFYADDYKAMLPSKMENKNLFSFLLLMACVPPSLFRMKQLGIQKELYENIPFIPIEKQIKKMESEGAEEVEDFPWDMNFYTCSIFFLERFYFIPFCLDDDIEVYRNKTDNKVIAFYRSENAFRKDGVLNGVNNIDKPYGKTIYNKTKHKLLATKISPCGVIGQNEEINLEDYELVLKKGDILLGFHIPGGPGYNVQNLILSAKAAKKLYDKYFPEISIKGIGSESWLYDPHLRLLLSEDSNIISMQNKMYIYPIYAGCDMIFGEMFGGEKNIDKLPQKTSLQKQAKKHLQKGGQFTTCSMFVLYDDIENNKSLTYTTKQDIENAKAMLGENYNEWL